MPITTPTLPQRIERIEADISSRLADGDALLRRSVLGVLARAAAGQGHMLQAYQEWLALQPFPDTAEAEYLERHARIWGVTRKAAVAATGTVSFTGTSGAVLPTGTELQRVDGQLYRTMADATMVAGAAVANVEAVEAGAAANTAAGQSLTLVAPVASIGSTVTVDAAGLTEGLDAEADTSLRTRLLARIQAPPHGGAAQDYESWALAVPGVTRAWVYPGRLGAGTVGVAIVSDAAPAGPLPSVELVATAQAYLDTKRPVTAEVMVFAPTPLLVPVTLHLVPDTAATRAAVQAELRDLFAREAEPGAVLYLSHLREAISLAPGETNHVLTAPVADIAPAAHEFPILGAITYA